MELLVLVRGPEDHINFKIHALCSGDGAAGLLYRYSRRSPWAEAQRGHTVAEKCGNISYYIWLVVNMGFTNLIPAASQGRYTSVAKSYNPLKTIGY